MSYTTVKGVMLGDSVESLKEFGNAWGSAPVIWDLMCTKYLSARPNSYWQNVDQLWPLWKDKSIPKHHRAVLTMTYDNAIVMRDDYQQASKDIRQFLADFPTESNKVNHWSDIADLFESNPDYSAIGFHMTSVSEDPFKGDYDDEIEDYGDPDWTKFWSVYKALDDKC